MKTTIGFTANTASENTEPFKGTVQAAEVPRKSLVQVNFPSYCRTLSYYNDSFDLHCGDIVFVDGKLEGMRGTVVDVTYNFKIKISDYKRVIGKADTAVNGELHMAGSHFIAFDKNVIPYSKILSWFKAPQNPEDEFATGSDDSAFDLHNLTEMHIRPEIAERGNDYYIQNKVVYICIDNGHGNAIVEGSKSYEIEFDYNDGKISNLTCDCYCSYTCKHQFAAMLQLNETLKFIEENYADKFAESNYFAAVSKAVIYMYAISDSKNGSITL